MPKYRVYFSIVTDYAIVVEANNPHHAKVRVKVRGDDSPDDLAKAADIIDQQFIPTIDEPELYEEPADVSEDVVLTYPQSWLMPKFNYDSFVTTPDQPTVQRVVGLVYFPPNNEWLYALVPANPSEAFADFTEQPGANPLAGPLWGEHELTRVRKET